MDELISVVLANRVSSDSRLVLEVNEEDYPVWVELGEWVNGGLLKFQPYLEAKIDGKSQKVDIAIKISAGCRNTILKVDTSIGDVYERVETESFVYYFPPQKKVRNQPTVISHVRTVGYEDLSIHFESHTETMRLISGYTDEDINHYSEYINDLLFMHQQLCIDKESSMSMALSFSKDIFEDTKLLVEDFCNAFEIIEKKPAVELKDRIESIQFRKIKKITSRAIIEHEILHKDKVKSRIFEESIDTFEHRVIKTFAKDLQRLIEIREQMQRHALETEYRKLTKYNDHVSDELLADIESEIGQAKINLINSLQKQYPTEKTIRVCIQTNVEKKGDSFLWFDTNDRRCMHLNVPKKNTKNRRYKIVGDDGWEWREYSIADSKIQQYVTQIRIPIDCMESAAFLFDFFQRKNIGKNQCIAIWGDIVESPNGKYFCNLEDGREFPDFVFEFRKIYGIVILDVDKEDNPILNKKHNWINASEVSDEEMRHIKNQFLSFLTDVDTAESEEYKGFLEEVYKSNQTAKKIENVVDSDVQKPSWDELQAKIQKVIFSELLNGVHDIRTPLKTSNLFSYDSKYKKIYDIILENYGTVTGCSYVRNFEPEIRMAKLPDLYERWCLIKMMVILINNYGFSLDAIDNSRGGIKELRKLIENILNGNDGLNGSVFTFLGSVGNSIAEITIFYDREFVLDYDKLKYINVEDKYKMKKLRPDFFIKIRCGATEKFYVLDAKYRGNNCYDGINDICNVAFHKYMFLLNSGIKWNDEFGISRGDIDGSFILHSSANTVGFERKQFLYNGQNIGTKYNSECYLGDAVDIWSNEWIANLKGRQKSLQFSEEKIREWSKWKYSSNNENKIGIVTCNTRTNNLVYIIQMIMERAFNSYADICWICGSPVEIEEKYTSSGYIKQHIKCKNTECNKFTVKTHCKESTCPSHQRINKSLGKHYYNYYSQAISKGQRQKWNVACPICRSLADKDYRKNLIEEQRAMFTRIPVAILDEQLPFD